MTRPSIAVLLNPPIATRTSPAGLPSRPEVPAREEAYSAHLGRYSRPALVWEEWYPNGEVPGLWMLQQRSLLMTLRVPSRRLAGNQSACISRRLLLRGLHAWLRGGQQEWELVNAEVKAGQGAGAKPGTN